MDSIPEEDEEDTVSENVDIDDDEDDDTIDIFDDDLFSFPDDEFLIRLAADRDLSLGNHPPQQHYHPPK